MITWNPVPGLVLTVTKPATTTRNLTATTDTIGKTIVHYSIASVSTNWPESIILTAGESGIFVTGNSYESFGVGKQMDYAMPDGTLGSATRIIDIPHEADLYNYHVDPRISETYTLVVNAHEGSGTYVPETDLPVPSTFQITVRNSWDSNKSDILNILSDNY